MKKYIATLLLGSLVLTSCGKSAESQDIQTLEKKLSQVESQISKTQIDKLEAQKQSILDQIALLNPKEKKDFSIEYQKFSDFDQSIRFQKTAILKGESSLQVPIQVGGRISSVPIKNGDQVKKGQVIARLSDSQGLYIIPLSQAQHAYESAQISYEQSKLNLKKNLDDLQRAYDKDVADLETARKNAEENISKARITRDDSDVDEKNSQATLNIEKAELDFLNLVENQEQQLSSYDLTYANEVQSVKNYTVSVVDFLDQLFSVTDKYRDTNEDFDLYLGAQDRTLKDRTESAAKILVNRYEDGLVINTTGDLVQDVQNLQSVYIQFRDILNDTEQVLIYSLEGVDFPAATISGYRSQVDGFQSTDENRTATLNNFTSQVNTFLNTYKNTRSVAAKNLEILQENARAQSLTSDSSYQQTVLNSQQSVRGVRDRMETSKSALEYAQNTYDISLKSLQNTIESARLQLLSAQERANKLIITAPISGTIGSLNLDVGQEVNPGTVLAHLTSLKTGFTIEVPREIANSLSIGDSVDSVYLGNNYNATIVSISTVANSSLLYPVELVLSDSIQGSGDFITAYFDIVSTKRILPLNIIEVTSGQEGRVSIWNEAEKVMEVKGIQLGLIWDDKVEVLAGLESDDRVVITDMGNFNDQEFKISLKDKQ